MVQGEIALEILSRKFVSDSCLQKSVFQKLFFWESCSKKFEKLVREDFQK